MSQRREYKEIQVSCTCGNSFVTRSTYSKSPILKIESCGRCHHYYTGHKKSIGQDKSVNTFFSKYAKVAKKEQASATK